MGWLQGVGVVLGMVILRVAVPVAFTVAFAYLVRRLDARMHPAAVR